MIHYFVPAAQEFGFREYLEGWGRSLAERARVRHYEELLEGGGTRPIPFEPGTYILSALDQLVPGMMNLVAEVHARLDGVEGFRFLNHPTRTLRRYELLTELSRRGLNDFRAVRATGDLAGLRYPVFLRGERSHDANLSPLLWSPAEVEAALGRTVMMRGRRPRDLLVVEFCPTSDRDGAYRRYAAYVVGERILPRSMDYSHQWMQKFHTKEYSLPVVLEERDYAFENPHAVQLEQIVRIAGVGYGRIDYAMKDDRVQIWEINLHPTIGQGRGRPSSSEVQPPELESIRQQGKQHFFPAFQAALEALDVEAEGLPAVDVALDPAMIRAARSTNVRRWRSSRALVKLLHPVRALLDPVGAPLFPLLGRIARRGAGGPSE